MSSEYHLIYWPGVPGRGEHARLLLEEAGAEYSDSAFAPKGADEVMALTARDGVGDGVNPPAFAPPALRHGDLLLSQTPNIVLYLGRRLGLAPPDGDGGLYHVNQLALTALDGLSNEVHGCHHPVSSALYYEDQKPESKRASEDYLANRLPKYLAYFERVLKSAPSGDGPWLYGGRLTFADLVLFQCLDGVSFMFPNAIAKHQKSGDFEGVFALYDAVRDRPRIKAYLASDRRQKYSMGIYRHYPELDPA